MGAPGCGRHRGEGREPMRSVDMPAVKTKVVAQVSRPQVYLNHNAPARRA